MRKTNLKCIFNDSHLSDEIYMLNQVGYTINPKEGTLKLWGSKEKPKMNFKYELNLDEIKFLLLYEQKGIFLHIQEGQIKRME